MIKLYSTPIMRPRQLKPERLLLLAIVMICSMGCHHDDDPNSQDAIVKTWILDKTGTLTKDGTDILSDDYIGLEISFAANKTYTTLNQGKLFKSSGSWQWATIGTTSLLLDSDFAVTVSELTKTQLQLHFILNTANGNGSRENSVAGEYVLTLKAKTS